jgi:hypothetical protein
MNTYNFIKLSISFFIISTIILYLPVGVYVTTFKDKDCNYKYSPEAIFIPFYKNCVQIAPSLYIEVNSCESNLINNYALYTTSEECKSNEKYTQNYITYDNTCVNIENFFHTKSIKVLCEINIQFGIYKYLLFFIISMIYSFYVTMFLHENDIIN